MAGKMALSAMPSRKRLSASSQKWRMTPVSAAKTPQAMSETKTTRVTLKRRASVAQGTWNRKYPRKKRAASSSPRWSVMLSVAARPAAAPKPKFARSR